MLEGSINRYISEYTPLDYAGQEVGGEILIDCSLGVNADPLMDSVFDTLHGYHQKTDSAGSAFDMLADGGNYDDIKFYPHDDSLKSLLVEWFIKHGTGEGWLSAENIVLGNGSFDILAGLNVLCLTRERTVLGHAPQFTAYIDHVRCTGSVYRAVPMRRSDNYRFNADDYLQMMSEETDLFIVENPNNPTGQSIPLDSIGRIAGKALAMDKILIVDEAYADYLPFGDSAVNLIDSYPNIIVTRSFSKGWGMAGLRLGYAVTSGETGLAGMLQKIVLPFNSNALARSLACSTLKANEEGSSYLFGIQRVKAKKKRLLDGIQMLNAEYGRDLRVAETHESTPIMLIYCGGGDREFDLFRHMMERGLLTVGCGNYPGLESDAVRLMLPDDEQMDLLMEIMETVVRDLPQ